MNDQKNKQQQPNQGNKQQDKDMNQQGHKPNIQNKDKDMNQQGKQDRQSVENDMNEPDQPEKSTQIGDNPDETKKKIPNMGDKH
ncbi:MAG TPA: hypothetical protein VFE32_01065 [Puia sp.]|nr:hypothetical protein [Puia sp.]